MTQTADCSFAQETVPRDDACDPKIYPTPDRPMTNRRSFLCLALFLVALIWFGGVAAMAQDSIAPEGQFSAPMAAALLQDLSPMGMYRAAHWVVRAVMLALGMACFVTWTVLVYKLIELLAVNARLKRAASSIRQGNTLADVVATLAQHADPAAFMARAAAEEMARSAALLAGAGSDGVKDRVRSILERVEMQAAKRLRRGTGVLATIAATAPFVGLFGTVWGIMNAFIRISETKSTNLAVVAPGIAEALLATAIGLVAAIPAVVFYNHFARSIANYRLMLGDAAAGIDRLVSRDLDGLAANRRRS